MTGYRINTIEDVRTDPEFPMSQAVLEPEGRRFHLTGQVVWTKEFEVIGKDDAGAQAALDNTEKVLQALGGTIEDVVATTMYYVHDEDLGDIQNARRARFSFNAGPAATGVKVVAMVDPELLVEMTVTAVIPNERFRLPKS